MKPILFTGEMVCAILAGNKTQTRRVANLSPTLYPTPSILWPEGHMSRAETDPRIIALCPYGGIGDRLWVRETLRMDDVGIWHYAADDEVVSCDPADVTAMRIWVHHKKARGCASIHMPRWASRITLELIDVRVQRLRDISQEDAEAEGTDGRDAFGHLWDEINEARGYPWRANPWVWALTFRRVED